jgi:hypothetical protein
MNLEWHKRELYNKDLLLVMFRKIGFCKQGKGFGAVSWYLRTDGAKGSRLDNNDNKKFGLDEQIEQSTQTGCSTLVSCWRALEQDQLSPQLSITVETSPGIHQPRSSQCQTCRPSSHSHAPDTHHYTLSKTSFLLFLIVQNSTQGLMLARWVLYHLSCTP